MKLEKRKPSGREKDEAAIELLEELRQKLYSDNGSVARRAAFNLSWMQEDGLEILKEALFSRAALRTKGAACYGLRSMHGRMKKLGMELMKEGAESSNRGTSAVCNTALQLAERTKAQIKAAKPQRRGKFPIREMRGRNKRRPISHASPLPGQFNRDRRNRRR